MVAFLARRAEAHRLTVQEARDGLIAWFALWAEPQIRKGMRFTSPGASREEIRHVLRMRAHGFVERLASSFEVPSWADLRRVKRRMELYLLPRRGRLATLGRERELWDYVLAGHQPVRVSALA